VEKTDPEFVLKGKTLKVYLYFLRHKEAPGISEVQHALGFSSPSVASHHLEKLIRLKVVAKDEFGRFLLEKKIDISVLQGFANISGVLLPRFSFYAGFFLVISISYVVLNLRQLNLLALIGTVGSFMIFSYESWRSWKNRPF